MRVGSNTLLIITDGSAGSKSAVITGWPYANMNWKDKFKN